MSRADVRVVAATVHGQYLIAPPASGPRDLWLVGFHGYAENASVHLDALDRIPESSRWTRVAVEALHVFYHRQTVVASWMTRLHREHAIADNTAYVRQVASALEQELGPPTRVVCCGFSQGVAMAWRAAAGAFQQVDAVIALGGDVPPELDRMMLARVRQCLIGRGRLETYYTADILARDRARLEEAGVAVHVCEFDGGHEWGQRFLDAAARFLDALAPASR